MFRARTPPEAIELVSRLLEYTPSSRISPLQACAHSFFNELREPNTRLPNDRELPPLFNFTVQGKLSLISNHLETRISTLTLWTRHSFQGFIHSHKSLNVVF